MLYSAVDAVVGTRGGELNRGGSYVLWAWAVLVNAIAIRVALEGDSLSLASENKRLKVLLADLCERKILLATENKRLKVHVNRLR
jgi:hypothetical protein